MSDYRELLGISDLAAAGDSGSGVRVAVIDTGIPCVDDIPVSMAENFTDDENSQSSEHAAAIGSILFGNGCVHGMCPKATSFFAKVFSGVTAKPVTVASAIVYASKIWKADVINLSLGFTKCSDAVISACESAIANGSVIVASSGNDGGDTMCPAMLPEVISVGASNGKASEDFSNTGKTDVVAPGVDLPALDHEGNETKKTGTSFSTAIISGMVALLLAKKRKTDPSARAADVKGELIDMCVDIGRLGKDRYTGYGFPFPNILPKSIFNNSFALSLRSFFATISDVAKKAIAVLYRPKSKETKKDE